MTPMTTPATQNTPESLLAQAEKALAKAKFELMAMKDTVFFCEVVYSFKYEFTYSVPTAATDGVKVYINPEFFMKWTKDQQVGLIVHEALHPIFMHMTRRGDRHHKMWNYAGDYVINLVITDRGMKLPDGGLLDEKYRDMTTEQVYDLLDKKAKNDPGFKTKMDSGEPTPGMGDDIQEPAGGDQPGDMDGSSKEQAMKDLQGQIEDILIRAAIRSKEAEDKPGTIPGQLEIFINGLLKPRLPWNKILRNYLSKYSKSDYSFRKPNRRFFPDHYLPSLYNTSLIDIAVAIDTSGSVSDHDFHVGISEIAAIFKMAKPEKITFIQFDTQIKSVVEVRSFHDLMNVEFTGRGGTEIGQVVEWAKKNKPQLLLMFTDGHFNFRDYSLKGDVLWMIHNNQKFKPKFGKAIHYAIRD